MYSNKFRRFTGFPVFFRRRTQSAGNDTPDSPNRTPDSPMTRRAGSVAGEYHWTFDKCKTARRARKSKKPKQDSGVKEPSQDTGEQSPKDIPKTQLTAREVKKAEQHPKSNTKMGATGKGMGRMGHFRKWPKALMPKR